MGGHVPKTTVEQCLTLSMGVVGQFEGLQERLPRTLSLNSKLKSRVSGWLPVAGFVLD